MRLTLCFRLMQCTFALLVAAGSAAQTVDRGIVYAQVGGRNLQLDLYRPTTGAAPVPVVVWLHDGGWLTGSRNPVPDYVLALNASGMAVASIDYRLTSQGGAFGREPVTFPAQIHDAKAAVRWLRANAAERGLDPGRIGAWGSSAGGHLAAMLGTSGDRPELEGVVGGELEHSSRVQVVVDYYGPTDLLNANADVRTPPGREFDHDAAGSPESLLLGFSNSGQGIGVLRNNLDNPTPPYPPLGVLAVQANPVSGASPGDAPTLAVHGSADRQVPLQQSQRLVDALVAAGVEAQLSTVNGAGHGGFPETVHAASREFLRSHLLAPTRVIVRPAALSGSWFDPASSGQGFTFQVLPGIDSEPRLLVFFYGHLSATTNLFLVGDTGFQPRYGSTINIPLLAVANGRFGPFDPAQITRLPWGELRLTFSHCDQAGAILEGRDGQQTLALIRLAGIDGLRCD